MENSDRTEFGEVRPNRDGAPFRARNGPCAQSQGFAWGRQRPLKTRLLQAHDGHLSVFATGMMAEERGLGSNSLCQNGMSSPKQPRNFNRSPPCALLSASPLLNFLASTAPTIQFDLIAHSSVDDLWNLLVVTRGHSCSNISTD